MTASAHETSSKDRAIELARNYAVIKKPSRSLSAFSTSFPA